MSANKSNIAFVGARGAGKSKIARRFARLSGRAAVSTDMLVSYESGGLSCAAIVRESGWGGFRDWEYVTLKKVVRLRNVIVDCGGGMLVESDESGAESFSERKSCLLQENCFIVYVLRDRDWLLRKVAVDAARPTLGADYEQILVQRLLWFERVADFTLDMRGRDFDFAGVALLEKFPPV